MSTADVIIFVIAALFVGFIAGVAFENYALRGASTWRANWDPRIPFPPSDMAVALDRAEATQL